MNSKETLKNKIRELYQKDGYLNFVDNERFPSVTRIRSILDSIKDLLFPGFYRTLNVNENQLFYSTIIDTIHDELRIILRKNLIYNDHNLLESEIDDKIDQILESFFSSFISIRDLLISDANAIYNGDPAAKSVDEVFIAYLTFQAIMTYRIAHFFYKQELFLVARMMGEIAHFDTSIDIHPGAHIGHSFCIDHGTGIVIGETAVIGNNVKLYQGVTLGAFSVKKSDQSVKRHPTLEDNVTVYAMSTILGGSTVVGKGSVIGANVWLTQSVPPNSKIKLSTVS